MTKELLKFEITEALAKVQLESALSLSFSNRGEIAHVATLARRVKKSLNYILKLIQEHNKKEQNND